MDEAAKSRSEVPWSHAHSAGGVVLRPGAMGYEFVAIRPAGHDRWQLPKGTIDRGETPQEAAVREVGEETGVRARILHDLGNISYFFRVRGRPFHKQVDFYLMVYLAGSTADHDHEVDEAVWLPATEVSQLTFKSERETVKKALQLVDTGVVDPAALDANLGSG